MLFALALCGLAACSRDSVDEVIALGDGNKANVELTFNVNSSLEVETRAAQSTYYEHLVQNIYVFVFNGDKRVDLSQDFFTSTEIEGYPDYDTENDLQSSGKINFDAISGSGLKICAIANIGVANSVIGDFITRATTDDTSSTDDGTVEDTTTADLAALDDITSYTELKKLSAELKNNTIFRGASFLMTGEVTDNLKATETTQVKIYLSRADSKITFNVTAASDDSTISDMKFTPGKWRVVNAPAVTYVLPHISTDEADTTLAEDKDATIDASDFFSVSAALANQFEGTVGDDDNSGTFTFYMYENLKKPTKEITDADVPSFTSTTYEGNLKYALREKQSKTNITNTNVTGVPGQTYVNGDFVNAPELGTYVVFTGELSYTMNKDTENEKYYMADVEYCVHLGHNSPTNVNCYNTLRNHHYTYNVTITGVNSLVVEVDNNQEERPGAEGDVVISATEIHNVDGHYDRALIKLTKEEASDLLFSVSTPFDRGLDNMDGDAELKDYKWIKFLVNSEVEVGNDKYAAYPGDQCYDGGASACGTGKESTVYGKNVVLRDVRQLSNYFRENNPTGDVYITVFIDEYLYFYDPTSDNVVTNGDATNTTYKGVQDVTANDTANLLMWKKSVNTNDRMLHIVKAGDMKYSADGETSVSRSVVTFKQRPILTFYNVAVEGLSTAWGTETINETPKMTVTRTSYPTAGANNYITAQQQISNGSPSWANVISSTEQYGLGSNYQDPSYACAMRNRDFNGNGTIDQAEVQWYLASLDQMSDLWIGEPAMPTYAHLYDEANPDGEFIKDNVTYYGTHFITSSIKSSESPVTPFIYWAEEYGANSSFYQSVRWSQAPMKEGTSSTTGVSDEERWAADKDNAIVSLRCVRNLGMAYSSTSIPQHYINTESVTTDDGTVTRLKLDYINPMALRAVADNGDRVPISTLNSSTENNRPYVSFDAYPGMLSYSYYNPYTYYWYQYIASERDSDYNPHNTTNDGRICPEGWRVPTQREMLIMSRDITSGWDNASWTWAIMINYQLVHDTDNTLTRIGAFYLYNSEKRISRSIGDIINSNVTENTADLVTDYLYNTNYTPTDYSAAVRCVRDNLSYTPPSSASAYNNGGSVTQ